MKTLNTIAIIFSIMVALYTGTAKGQPPIPSQEQPQVLTRGPVHEAFSEPVILQLQDGLVVPFGPPADIDEIPPSDGPEGDDYVWVPGYWSWDGDRNNYIWVTGCWRQAPPDMSWMPGYWCQVNGGWEWVAGFWTPTGNQDIEYLPAPPTYDDMDQPGSSPSADDIWVPSCQYWTANHYVERPGYWLAENPNWVWAPSHYVWTPRGYVFCNGHWDYPLANRGVLFAPVYFPEASYRRQGFSYSPTIVVNIGALTVNLFTYPKYSHFYFGDYYDDSYLNIGIFPRDEVVRNHTWYDPTYVHDRWEHRSDSHWADNERHDYDQRHNDKAQRPPSTYQEMQTRQASKSPGQQQNNFRIVEPLTEVVANKSTPVKFQHIDSQSQQKIAKEATAVHSFRSQRNNWESSPAPQGRVQPGTNHPNAAIPPAQQKQPVVTNEHKSPATSPQQRPEPVVTKEHAPAVTTPQQRPEPVVTKEHAPNVTAPPERKAPVAAPAEHNSQMTTPAAQKEQPTQPKQNRAQFVPPRQVPITQPQRVKTPAPPIAAKRAAAVKSLPAQPANERRYKAEAKSPAKVAPGAANAKEKPADKATKKGKGK